MAYTTINKSTDNFNTKLYTGNGSTQSITGVGFQPDWVWTKKRNGTTGHRLVDSVRGVTKALFTNGTNAETTESNGLTAFASDGYTLGTDGNYNANSDTYVSWNWLASGSTASNTDGSITSTVSANTTAGFSIVSYTGSGSAATIGHGLGSTPQVIIIKNRSSSTYSWEVGHSSIGFTKKLKLDTTSAEITDTGAFNNTAPTSSVFTVGNNSSSNGSGNNMIAYCFAEKAGYSKFGKYTGNGNADGPFIYTGFKPAMVILKNTSTTGNWQIMDNKRNIDNPVDTLLKPNDSIADQTPSDAKDFLSNGFKLKNSATEDNGNNNTFIFMAFGQTLVGSNQVPCTAR